MLKAAKSYDSRVSVDSGNFSAQVATDALANSNGIELKERASVFSWSIMGMAIENTEISSFDYQVGGSHYVKDINVSNTAGEFAETVVKSLGTRKIEESFKGEMLLTPMARKRNDRGSSCSCHQFRRRAEKIQPLYRQDRQTGGF